MKTQLRFVVAVAFGLLAALSPVNHTSAQTTAETNTQVMQRYQQQQTDYQKQQEQYQQQAANYKKLQEDYSELKKRYEKDLDRFEKPTSWGVAQVILAGFMIVAAWRHRLVGLWILASAAILSLVSSVAFLVAIKMSTDGRPSPDSALILVSYPTLVMWLLVLSGCAVLAFTRPKKASQ